MARFYAPYLESGGSMSVPYAATGMFAGSGSQSSQRLSNVTIAFGNNKKEVRTVVADAAITSTSVIIPQVTTEDYIVQDVKIDVMNIVQGVGYTLVSRAPHGASGNLVARVSIQG